MTVTQGCSTWPYECTLKLVTHVHTSCIPTHGAEGYTYLDPDTYINIHDHPLYTIGYMRALLLQLQQSEVDFQNTQT